MGTLIDRPMVYEQFHHKYPQLVCMYGEDLNVVKVMFDRQLALSMTPGGPRINKNMPRVAGLLKWAQELMDRVQGGMEKLKTLNHM